MDAATNVRLLIADSNTVVGLGIQDDLEQAGYAVAGPFASCAQATAWLESDTPGLAILAVHLQDGTCVDLARELRERDVPMIVYSGERRQAIPELQEALWLEKPATPATLLIAVADLVGGRERRYRPGTRLNGRPRKRRKAS
jgi:DNA-binding response OmpR family regulator